MKRQSNHQAQLATLVHIRQQRVQAASARKARCAKAAKQAADAVNGAESALRTTVRERLQQQQVLEAGYQGQEVNINTILQWRQEETALAEQVTQAKDRLEQHQKNREQALAQAEEARADCLRAWRHSYKAEQLQQLALSEEVPEIS